MSKYKINLQLFKICLEIGGVRQFSSIFNIYPKFTYNFLQHFMNQNQKMMQLEMLEKISKMLKETFLAINEICQQQIQQNHPQNRKNKDSHASLHKSSKKASKKAMQQNQDQNSQSEESRKRTGKKKKQAKWQIEGKPRPPLNAFMLFLRDSKFQIQQARPELSSSQVSTYASTIWNDLPEEQKQKYRQQYLQNKKLYDIELQAHMKKFGYESKVKKNKKKKKNKQKDSQAKKQVVEIDDSQEEDDSMMI